MTKAFIFASFAVKRDERHSSGFVPKFVGRAHERRRSGKRSHFRDRLLLIIAVLVDMMLLRFTRMIISMAFMAYCRMSVMGCSLVSADFVMPGRLIVMARRYCDALQLCDGVPLLFWTYVLLGRQRKR